MLEGTDAKIHFVQYTPEMELLRGSGGLRTNSFVHIRKLPVHGEPTLDVQELGDSDTLLANRHLLEEKARALVKIEVLPTQDG
jgi:hypothetical protein